MEKEWRRRLGHPSKKNLCQILNDCNVKFISSDNLPFFYACQLGKSHSLPFKQYESQAIQLHIDLWGLALVVSISGHKFYIAFIDDFSRHT